MPLTAEEVDLLCRVGPDTPMGQVLRRYWYPAFLLADLPVPDCPPIGVQVLGENFVAFRDTSGEIGFIDELCCHRGASLTYGRVEEGGIRCIYHGWKCDIHGNLLETPNGGGGSAVRDHVKQGSYPVQAAGGLGWVYIGPSDTEPEFPHFPWMDTPEEEITAGEVFYDCNWLQVQEGSLDSSHLGIMHVDNGVVMQPGPPMVGSLRLDGLPWSDKVRPPGALPGMPTTDNDPVIEVEQTPFGFQYAALRWMPDSDDKYVRISACVFPYVVCIGSSTGAVIVVPRDDENCSMINVGGRGRVPRRLGTVREPTADGLRQFRFPSDGRRYTIPPQDRRAMAGRTMFAGWRDGNRPQDSSVQGVNGKVRIYHRRTEHLVQADVAVLMIRQLLFDSVRRLEAGQAPHGLEPFDFRTLQAAHKVVGPNDRWQDLVANNHGRAFGAGGELGRDAPQATTQTVEA
jgi:phthalate 4,5-dioxygenase